MPFTDDDFDLLTLPGEGLTCDHVGAERVPHTCTGFLGDGPKGAVVTLCGACGTELDEVLR